MMGWWWRDSRWQANRICPECGHPSLQTMRFYTDPRFWRFHMWRCINQRCDRLFHKAPIEELRMSEQHGNIGEQQP